MLKLSLVVFALFAIASSRKSKDVHCPRIPPAPVDFNTTKVMGTWYEVMRDPQPRKIEKCVLQTIMPGEGESLRLTTMGQDADNKTVSEVSYAYVRDPKNPHVLSVKFPTEIQEIPFTIVDLGMGHMLVHSCVEVFGLWKMEEVTLYSRWTNLDMSTGMKMMEKIEKLTGLPARRVKFLDQVECRQQ